MAVRLNSLRVMGQMTVPLGQLLHPDPHKIPADIRNLVVQLPEAHIKTKQSETALGLTDPREPLLNCFTINKAKAASADCFLRLPVVDNGEWDFVALAFQDKLFYSRSAPMAGEAEKIFFEGCHQPKDKLIMVVRSPFRTQGGDAKEGQTVVMMEDKIFRKIFRGLLDPVVSLCINTATSNELKAHLGLEESTAAKLHGNIQAGGGQCGITSLDMLECPEGMGRAEWEALVGRMQALIRQGLLFF